MVEALELFFGEQPQLEAVNLLPGDDLVAFSGKLSDSVARVNDGDGVVVFCDLPFASPCNVAGSLLNRMSVDGGLHVIAGMNLPMILEFLGSRDGSEMNASDLIRVGREGMVDLNARLGERTSD